MTLPSDQHAENERHIPMFETPNLDGKIPCLCGERFATWRDWCRHRGEQSDGSVLTGEDDS